ncbi:MAG TPA: enolase C-terminal domain-like protein [Candidatus Dormibacteraeota bacterium]|nr:enolase C-terminal domain-like protein [Candidatus Dormibacteraeota bacterium]
MTWHPEGMEPRIRDVEADVFALATDMPGGDGTLTWDSTTMVVVEVMDDSGESGLGYTYGAAAAAAVVKRLLRPVVVGRGVDEPRAAWNDFVALIRNAGRPGIGATAISALDMALWDLKARRADQALFVHLGAARHEVPIYGSGGLTTYSDEQLTTQLRGWVEGGIPRVKMKVGKDWGRSADEDVRRVAAARRAIGPEAALFVDANGAYTTKQAVAQARRFAEHGVTYFEEPVSSDQLEQLALVRGRIDMTVAAGEYGFDPWYFRQLLDAGAVDIVQADATRCLGVTGWLMAADLAYAAGLPLSAHCAPAIHSQLGCVAPAVAHIEYFHDHVRMESMLFEGVLAPSGGCLRPDPLRPGLGLKLRPDAAERLRQDAPGGRTK